MATTSAPEGWLADYAATGTSHSTIGIIFVHGFTGSPASMRPRAHFFQEKGYTVRVPRLPGHGTQWEDLNQIFLFLFCSLFNSLVIRFVFVLKSK